MNVRSIRRRIRKMALCLTKQGVVVYIDREDQHINDFDFKREGMQFVITKLLSSDYFELFNLAMDQIKSVQWYYAIGREAVGGWRRMVSEQKGPFSVEELKRLWNEVECDMFLFHLGSDYRNYTGLEFTIG